MCLLAGSARWVGLAVLGLGAGLIFTTPQGPDLLVERSGANVALRDASGHLVPALPRKARFTVEKWLQVNGEEISPAEAAKRPGWTCRDSRCEATINTKRIAYISGAEGKAIDCSGLDILIADYPLRRSCNAVPLRIDRFDLWRKGAHAIQVSQGGATVTTARDAQGARPWVVVPEARKTPFKPR
jgi:competence protein ComEC